jgi:hypothetical protein
MKKADLDEATIAVVRRMLSTPPKRHDEMKIGRPAKKKKHEPKVRASSSKRSTAS